MSPQIVEFFAGGGGVAEGLKQAGFDLKFLLSVEKDPKRIELSKKIADLHEANFPDSQMLRLTVEEVADNYMHLLDESALLHWYSPPCTNFSKARMKKADASNLDWEAASAIAKIIKTKKPQHIVLENVCDYRNSDSFLKILSILKNQNYRTTFDVLDLSDFGSATKRVRLILRASLNHRDVIRLPEKVAIKNSWHKACSDLVFGRWNKIKLEPSCFTKTQLKFWDSVKYQDEMYWIDRVSVCGKIRICSSSLPLHTMTRQIFHDGKGGSRHKFADIVYKNKVYQATPRMLFRIQGFSDSYRIEDKPAVWGSALGNSVPPSFVCRLLKPLQHNYSVKVA